MDKENERDKADNRKKIIKQKRENKGKVKIHLDYCYYYLTVVHVSYSVLLCVDTSELVCE